jgi:hypothetical protein
MLNLPIGGSRAACWLRRAADAEVRYLIPLHLIQGGRNAMSHIVTVTTKMRNPLAVAAACTRLGLAPPMPGTVQLYSGQATGLIVQLPGWTYPAVIDTTSGRIAYDNYHGAWGAQAELDRFLQAYAIELCRLEARKKGYQITEQALQDGSVKLHIIEGGG